jgi:hypothetical protein
MLLWCQTNTNCNVWIIVAKDKGWLLRNHVLGYKPDKKNAWG